MSTYASRSALALLFAVGACGTTPTDVSPETSPPASNDPRVAVDPNAARPPIAIPEPAAHCEGLADECLLPWPSSRWLVVDPSTATGKRVSLPADALPKNADGVAVAPDSWNRWDGFSPMTSAIVQLSGPVDRARLVDYRHVEQSLENGASTVLLDATTGERVAHWSEVEDAPDADPQHPTLYVRPAARLAEDHHYVVAIRRVASGPPMAPPAFRALRDRVPTTSARLEARRASFEKDVFAPLTKAGVERATLTLAWDFHTASGVSARGDLVAMRDDAVAFAGADGAGCAVGSPSNLFSLSVLNTMV